MSVQLRLDGLIHSGWQEVSVTRSMERIAAECNLQWGGYNAALQIDAACQLLLDGHTVLDGYVDELTIDQQAGSRRGAKQRSW